MADEETPTTMSIAKPVLQKIGELADYVENYTRKSHNRSEVLTLVFNNIDYKNLNKKLDEIRETYELEITKEAQK